MPDLSLDNYERPKLNAPNGGQRILLHSCCAPCSGEVMDAMAASGIETTIFFYNPNIHPRSIQMCIVDQPHVHQGVDQVIVFNSHTTCRHNLRPQEAPRQIRAINNGVIVAFPYVCG